MRQIAMSAGAAALAVMLQSSPAGASVVGDIQASYGTSRKFVPGAATNGDGVEFYFENSSGADITNGIFSVTGVGAPGFSDTFTIGTIVVNGGFVLVPGVSTDGGSGHTFFGLTGGGDTSDESFGGVPASSNALQFLFTGQQGGAAISSGVFMPAATYRLSNDGSQMVNFVGGPNGDACNDCFGPAIVAQLVASDGDGGGQAASVPEPASVALLIAGVLGSIGLGRRRA